MYRTYRLATDSGKVEGPYSIFELLAMAKKRIVVPSSWLVEEDGTRLPAGELLLLRSAFRDIIPSMHQTTPWRRHSQPTTQYMQRIPYPRATEINLADLPKFILGAFVFPIFFCWRHKEYQWVAINVIATLFGLGLLTSLLTMYHAPKMAVKSGLYGSVGEVHIEIERWNKAAAWSVIFTLTIVCTVLCFRVAF